jgi:hypothetical protein
MKEYSSVEARRITAVPKSIEEQMERESQRKD